MTGPKIVDRGARGRQPLPEEMDHYGVTHRGKVRETNQDNFMIASLQKRILVHHTSLESVDDLAIPSEPLAYMGVVADGVGGGLGGEEASRLAIENAMLYVQGCVQCYYSTGSHEDVFLDALTEAALQVHASVVQGAEGRPELHGMATTLTLAFGVWPHAYVLQVGDSRCYLLRENKLVQITRDQTLAQALIDKGVLTRSDADDSRAANILLSAIGGSEAKPVVTRVDDAWHSPILCCSDGLTKHVPDGQIERRLQEMTSAQQASEALLQDALDGGGSDNITILIGRVRKAPS